MFIGTWFWGRSVSWSPKLAVAHPWKSYHLAWAEHHSPPEVICASWNKCLYTRNSEGLVLRTRQTWADHSHCAGMGAIGASTQRKSWKGAASCTSACGLHYLPRGVAYLVLFLSSGWDNSSLRYLFPRWCPDHQPVECLDGKREGQGKLIVPRWRASKEKLGQFHTVSVN